MSDSTPHIPKTATKHHTNKGCCKWLGTTKYKRNTQEIYECGGSFYTAHYSPPKGITTYSTNFSKQTVLNELRKKSKERDYLEFMENIRNVIIKVQPLTSREKRKCICGARSLGHVTRDGHEGYCKYLK
jgi:hypothetical protein